jgi:branched-chain amino acid transport system substrate-binding protein
MRPRRSMRAALLVLLALGVLVAVSACGGDGGGEAAPPAEAPAAPPAEEPAATGEEPAATGEEAAATGEEAAPAGAPSGEPILIGITTAQTGILAPYDLQASQLFEMRIEQLNAEGGVLGRPIETQWIDSKSDQAQTATNADELIGNGAVVVIATCDFDYSFPAIQAAGTADVPGIALCASSPKVATPDIVGPYGGSMGLGSDAEGVAMAEWLAENRPELKRAYVFRDDSLEYSKATADYFKARWLELGGEVCGEDTFVGGPDLDLSSQVTRLRGEVENCDFVYDGSWQPYGSQLVRAIRDAGMTDVWIVTNASVNGTLVNEVAGNVSNFLALGFACLPTYCEGTQTEQVVEIAQQFEEKYGEPLGNHYALPGYALADAVVDAIEAAGSTEGPAIAEALFSGQVQIDYFGTPMAFTENCHRPQPAGYSVEEFQNGVNTQIDTVVVQQIPDIGDGSPCSGTPPAAGG